MVKISGYYLLPNYFQIHVRFFLHLLHHQKLTIYLFSLITILITVDFIIYVFVYFTESEGSSWVLRETMLWINRYSIFSSFFIMLCYINSTSLNFYCISVTFFFCS